MTVECAQLNAVTTLTADIPQSGYHVNIDGARIQDPFNDAAGVLLGNI